MSHKIRQFSYNLAWFILIVAMGVLVYLNRIPILDMIMAIGYEPSAEIQSTMTDIKLTEAGERILRASRPEIQSADAFNENCPADTDSATLGCYYRQHIYVYDVTNQELAGIKQAVLAHELLHAAWSRMTRSEQDEIEPYLTNFYAEHDELKKHLAIYTTESQADELHSVIGTEYNPADLPTKLRTHYAQFFSDHAVIYNFYNQYHDKFASIQKRTDELETQIDAKQKQLDSDTASYNQLYDQLNRDIASFNQKANTEGGFASRQEFDRQRNILVQRRDDLTAMYQRLSAATDELNALIEEYNQNLVRSTRLYDSIDSRAKNPTIIFN